MAQTNQTKRIMVSVPAGLLDEVDSFGARNGINRSEVVRRAMRLLVAEGARSQIIQMMATGYTQMAQVNLDLAQECATADEDAYSVYQRWLDNV
ncbi:MAG: Antitoxin EndoAI [Firmicutes bacterium ADurb.Bin506]|nr:MAG: Antitoxin EndoAI [Firmicutes bacterium ADurb.Bin506]